MRIATALRSMPRRRHEVQGISTEEARSMRWLRLVTALSAAMISAVASVPATADPKMIKEAKDLGLPAQNCQYCHVSKVPKKETFKPDDLNERGKWLLTEKDKRKAKEVKADWLTSYPGGKEQK
jgi:hypothetical protein